jgi:tetratricopeptide (TPR) repeat protein
MKYQSVVKFAQVSALVLLLGLFGLCGVGARASDLPPLKLMSPLSAVSLDGLAVEAEAAYSIKNMKSAEDGFMTILELDPSNRRALFRMGNIHQQQGQPEKAISFYRQASQTSEFSQQLDEYAEKALINIALISTEQAKLALAELEKRKPSAKFSEVAQRLVDELSDNEASIATRVSALQKKPAVKRNVVAKPIAPAASVQAPIEVIGGIGGIVKVANNESLKPAPRVTYSQQADPTDDAPVVTYLRGIPAKVSVPKTLPSSRYASKKKRDRATPLRQEL